MSWKRCGRLGGGVIASLGAVLAVVLLSPQAAFAAAPNDPLYAKQWGLQQIHAEQAWTKSTGSGVVIAVVDSGVDLSHPDLQGKLVPGATFAGCPDPGPYPCGNGDWKGVDGIGQRADRHGTHVAGIAAAATGNGVGVAGVARDAKIMPVKVLEDGGGFDSDIAAGIYYAVDHGAKVVNLSLGGDPTDLAFKITGDFKVMDDAIQYAYSHGVLTVVAAGNENSPFCYAFAWQAGVMCVVATDRNEQHASYSNFGVNDTQKAVAAPGGAGLATQQVPLCDEDIWSAVPAGTEGFCGNSGFNPLAGTSMATPHVSGVAALLYAQGRSLNNIIATLDQTARTPGTGARGVWTPDYGWGIVDAQAAVNAPMG